MLEEINWYHENPKDKPTEHKNENKQVRSYLLKTAKLFLVRWKPIVAGNFLDLCFFLAL